MSSSSQTDELVLAIKKLGKTKSDADKPCEPELFTGKDPKCSSSNVNYIPKIQTSEMILRKLPLNCPTFGMLLRNGLNPVSPDLPRSLQSGLITGKLSWMNFIPTLGPTIKLVTPNTN
jgi:hypothetical protein